MPRGKYQCLVCRRRFPSCGRLTQHTARKQSCKLALQQHWSTVFQHLKLRNGESESDSNSNNEPDGDLMHLVYHDDGPHVLEERLDQTLDDALFQRVKPAHETPDPPEPPPAPSFRATVTAEPEDDQGVIVDLYVGGGQFLRKRRDPAISADFATFDSEWGPFENKSDWQFAMWSTLETVSDNAVSRLLKIEALSGQLSARSACDIKSALDRLPAPASFNHHEVYVSGVEEPFDLYWRDPLEVIGDLLADPTFAGCMSFAPERRYVDDQRESRLYNEMHTAAWWWGIQVRVHWMVHGVQV